MAAMNQNIDAIMDALNIVLDPTIGKPRGSTKNKMSNLKLV